jgi:hypothetical protein
MSAWSPTRSAGEDGNATGSGGSAATVVSGGVVCSIDAAQHAHVHRTQNAGQPLSGADSLVPIGQLSGTTRELMPLASDMSTASTAMNNTRDIPVNIPVRFSAVRGLASGIPPQFDTVEPVQHPKEVLTLIRRLSAVVAILTLCVGNVALCAGWQATPETRMACCMSGPSCPMHKSESHDHSSKNGISQAQADSCCAASAQRRESSSPASTFGSSGVIALVPAAVFSVPTTVRAAQEWRVLVPLPVSSVPKHLLLSVLLV